jgi:hypothetical protein
MVSMRSPGDGLRWCTIVQCGSAAPEVVWHTTEATARLYAETTLEDATSEEWGSTHVYVLRMVREGAVS